MINDITVHRITNVRVEASSLGGREGPFWIDVIVERPHAYDQRQERFEFAMFCKERDQTVALLEKMKHDITNILQEFDKGENDEQA